MNDQFGGEFIFAKSGEAKLKARREFRAKILDFRYFEAKLCFVLLVSLRFSHFQRN